jgi:peptide-methionine (S)-S-oxide reductase
MFRRRRSPDSNTETSPPRRDESRTISGIHYVNETPITPPFPDGMEVFYVGMGCFWGAERVFWQLPGVYTTAVGYQGGMTQNPTYEEVCTGTTGHAETALVVYDPSQTSLDVLLKSFWEQHDPTQGNRQGNDVGTQYRSVIYWTTREQRDVAIASRDAYGHALSGAGFGEITTEIDEAPPFFYAEEYHQQYLAKNPGGYCNHGFCQIEYVAPDL